MKSPGGDIHATKTGVEWTMTPDEADDLADWIEMAMIPGEGEARDVEALRAAAIRARSYLRRGY